MKPEELMQELKNENKMLSVRLNSLEQKLSECKEKLVILTRMTDEWAKSYDNLLKDFIHYRNENQ